MGGISLATRLGYLIHVFILYNIDQKQLVKKSNILARLVLKTLNMLKILKLIEKTNNCSHILN